MSVQDRDLPADAAVGDLFVIHDTGAHSHSMGFQYNGKLRAAEVLLTPGDTPGSPHRAEVIRDAETVHCLFDNTHVPPRLQSGAYKPWPYHGRPAAPACAAATPTAAEYDAKAAKGSAPRSPAPGAVWGLLLPAVAVGAAFAAGLALRAWARRA
jgi:hypothetical protein